jgi:transposase
MSGDVPAPRFRAIDRSRVSSVSLDQQLPDPHPARIVWDFVCQLDLSRFDRPHKAVEGRPGAPIVPARLLFALWLYAVLEGVQSARHLAELCERDLPFQWLCGGDPVSYHLLSDFYSQHGPALRQTQVEHVAALRLHGLVELSETTIDGRKVPASASKDSHRRDGTLRRHLEEAERHLAGLQAQKDEGPARSARQHQARPRGARDRRRRLQQAVEQVRRRQDQRREMNRQAIKPEGARASETDPDRAKMKRPDGGYRPCYNVQTMAETKGGLIVAVAVTARGSDNGLLGPLVEQVCREQGQRPKCLLADSGYSDLGDVEALERAGVEVLMPPKNEKKERRQGKDPYARKRRDNEHVAAWRARLGTEQGKDRYRRRAPLAEGVHAQQANRGFVRFRLRGQEKAEGEAYWQALAHNVERLMRRGIDLGATARAERN